MFVVYEITGNATKTLAMAFDDVDFAGAKAMLPMFYEIAFIEDDADNAGCADFLTTGGLQYTIEQE